MDEVQAVEGVAGILDAAEHVDAALLAGVTLDGGRRVDDLQLLLVGRDAEAVAGDHGDHGEEGAVRLPALGTAAHVVVGTLGGDRDLDPIAGAVAVQGAAAEALAAGLEAAVHPRVNPGAAARWRLGAGGDGGGRRRGFPGLAAGGGGCALAPEPALQGIHQAHGLALLVKAQSCQHGRSPRVAIVVVAWLQGTGACTAVSLGGAAGWDCALATLVRSPQAMVVPGCGTTSGGGVPHRPGRGPAGPDR